ncbi:MAG: hypothetical protein IH586_14055, partial [Anaerolineaceae bacterium]|nr:hypothetical protein [Anaerolineaceae bacterium]
MKSERVFKTVLRAVLNTRCIPVGMADARAGQIVYDGDSSVMEDTMATDSEKILAALGPLAELYADPNVLEIMVDTPEQVLVERGGRLVQAEVKFASAEAIRGVIDALLA